ncbi:sugar transporter [Veronia nyctiphanis]|uniref:Sugar transporter n=1 Tax=Veronia nyctiphanis TaxID=1278244 RepID=A0A4Q0YTU0_9GAMM|nr:sugar transporter [Veronia nyctiphanis]
MRSKVKLLALILPIALVSGCTLTGSHLSTEDKRVVTTSEENDSVDISKFVLVHPLTASSVSAYKSKLPESRPNPDLDKSISAYEYRVGAGDVLNVIVWDHPELTTPAGQFRSPSDSGLWVDADGTIFYPYIGRVDVLNKTVSEIRAIIAKRLAKYVEKPQVDVNVAAFRSQKVHVTGEVAQPGQQPITNIPMTLLDAVNRAGGLSENANWKKVTIVRNGVKETTSLYALMQRGDMQENRLLQAGDIVNVASNDNQNVYVFGEVQNPQLLKITRNGMSLTAALSSVGGINELEADATGIFVIRGREANATEATANNSDLASNTDSHLIADLYQLNIKDATALVVGTEFELEPKDIVYVTAAPISRWNRVIRQLLPTISGFDTLTDGVRRVRNWPN